RPAGGAHHGPFGGRPVGFARQRANPQPLPPRGEIAPLGAGHPEIGLLSQEQFSPPAARLLLPAHQPPPHRRNKKVVRELVIRIAYFEFRISDFRSDPSRRCRKRKLFPRPPLPPLAKGGSG